MSELDDGVLNESAPLTVETLLAAIEQIRDRPPSVCGVTHPHVVHPQADGWVACANCFQPVQVSAGPNKRLLR